MSESLRPHGLKHTGLPVHHQLLEFTQTLSIESVKDNGGLGRGPVYTELSPADRGWAVQVRTEEGKRGPGDQDWLSCYVCGEGGSDHRDLGK